MSIVKFHKTVVALGEGDVLTGLTVDEYGVGHFVFQPAPEAKAPGTPAPELDGKYSVEDADVVIMFKDVASIDRVIADLYKLRTDMGGAV